MYVCNNIELAGTEEGFEIFYFYYYFLSNNYKA